MQLILKKKETVFQCYVQQDVYAILSIRNYIKTNLDFGDTN